MILKRSEVIKSLMWFDVIIDICPPFQLPIMLIEAENDILHFIELF